MRLMDVTLQNRAGQEPGQGDEPMDKDFFVQELEARSGMLYRVAYTILHDDDACRDALQDAALKACQ